MYRKVITLGRYLFATLHDLARFYTVNIVKIPFFSHSVTSFADFHKIFILYFTTIPKTFQEGCCNFMKNVLQYIGKTSKKIIKHFLGKQVKYGSF